MHDESKRPNDYFMDFSHYNKFMKYRRTLYVILFVIAFCSGSILGFIIRYHGPEAIFNIRVIAPFGVLWFHLLLFKYVLDDATEIRKNVNTVLENKTD